MTLKGKRQHMFINDFENSNEYKLHQILHTLKSVHGVELKCEGRSADDLNQLLQSSEIIKNSIVSESRFNTYNTNPEYTKHTLIMEAIRLFLTEIAPKRQKKTKVKENAVPSIPPTPAQPAGNSTNANATPTPGTVKVQKGTDTKSVPASQLANLQSQGYKVIGDDDTQSNVSENGLETAPDGHSPELEMLMKKYGVEGDDVDEGMKEKLGGMYRRAKDTFKTGIGRADMVHHKANAAYAADDKRTGDRYMNVLNRGAVRSAQQAAPKPRNNSAATPTKVDAQPSTKPFGKLRSVGQIPYRTAESAGTQISPELEALMKRYGVDSVVDEGMKEKIGGIARRMKQQSYPGQNRADLVHHKANAAYALGDKKAGNRYMDVLNKGAVRSAQQAVAKPKNNSTVSTKTNTQSTTKPFGKLKPIGQIPQKLGESAGTDPNDYQASMARAELYRNTKYAMEMLRLIRPTDDVQPWISSNLVQAGEYLDQVFHYMDYYTKFEPQSLPEEDDMSLDVNDSLEPNLLSAGAIAREHLLMIVEYSTKLFNIIQPGDKLEGWVAMKLTSASNAISNSKHYLDYVQFEKHASDHIAELAPEEPLGDDVPMIGKNIKETVGTMLMKMMVNEDQDLAQAQALMAAKSLSDDLMTMAEKVSKMSVEDLLPLVDTMKDQFGPEAAEGYSSMMKQTLDTLLNATTEAKNTSDNAITQLQGGSIPSAATDIGGEEGGSSLPGGDDTGLGGAEDSGASMPEVPEEPLGRSRKNDELAEAWGKKMNTPASKKGMWDGCTLAELKAKKKKLMDKEKRSAAESKQVKELDFAIRAKQKNKWSSIKESKMEAGLKDDMPRVVSGVKGVKSTPFKKKFRNAAAMNKWMDSEECDNCEIHQIEKDQGRSAVKEADQDIFGKKPTIRSKFVGADLQGIRDFLNDKCTFDELEPNLQKKLRARYGKDTYNSEEMHDALADASRKNEFGSNFTAKRETLPTRLEERNKANALKKKTVINPKKREEKKEPFDFRNLTDKSVRDSKKVTESAPPGKKAEDFIKDNKESFKKRYGKKGEEVLYATAWKKFGNKKESFEKAGKMLESHKVMLAKLERAFAAHKVGYKQMVKEGKADDPLNMGYGLEGELILEQINDIKGVIAKIKDMIRAEIQQGAISMVIAEKQADKLSTVVAAKKVAPWGVAWKTKAGKNQAKFFESQSDRDYWVGLKSLNEATLINPKHFDKEIAKLSTKKD